MVTEFENTVVCLAMLRSYCYSRPIDDMTAAEPLGSDREALIAGGPHGHPELMDRLYAETEKNAKVILWQNMLEHWECTCNL